jgi:hypothetical protein
MAAQRLPADLGDAYEVVLVRTHVIQPREDLAAVVRRYLGPVVRPGDVAFISEKVVAVTQGRFVWAADIQPGALARFLCRYVSRNPAGMGVRRPVVMEMAIREVGWPRILLAAVAGALARPFGRRGVFYRVAGRRVAAIDGPNPHTIRPYRYAVVLMPLQPERVARRLARVLGVPVAIVDANDLGVEVLGRSPGVDERLVIALLRTNPMGQASQQTPMGLIRPRRLVGPAATARTGRPPAPPPLPPPGRPAGAHAP